MGHRHYGVVFFLLFSRGILKTSSQQITVKTVWCSICCRNDIGPQSRTKHTNYRQISGSQTSVPAWHHIKNGQCKSIRSSWRVAMVMISICLGWTATCGIASKCCFPSLFFKRLFWRGAILFFYQSMKCLPYYKYTEKLLLREIFLCSQFLLSTFPPFCEMVSRFGWQSWIRHCVMHNPSVLYSQYCDFVGSYPSWWTLLILVVSRVTVCLSWNSVPHLRWLEKSGIWH